MADKARREFLKYRERGNCDALGRVFDEVAPKLLQVAMHVVRDRAQAEDVVQETFLSVMRNADRYDSRQALFPWLIGILQNEARRRRRTEERTPDPRRLTEQHPSSPFDRAKEADLLGHLSRCVSDLPETYRAVLDLYLSKDLHAAEIGTALGRPTATVHTQLRRGLQMLRRALPAGLAIPVSSLTSSCSRLSSIRDLVMQQASAASEGLAPVATTGAASLMTLGGIVVFKKSVTLVLICLMALIIPLWLLWGGEDAASATDTAIVNQESRDALELTQVLTPDNGDPKSGTNLKRQVVQALSALPRLAVTSSRCGFTGRVVDADGSPVPSCDVRIYRLAMDELAHLQGPTNAALITGRDFLAGEAQTDAKGTFTISGAQPRGFFLFQGGVGTDSLTHLLVRQTPGPDELVDLGDIELEQAAVLEGIVVDSAGKPVPRATVRAADVSAQLLALVPAEHFDAAGVLLVRDQESSQVVEIPSWLDEVIQRLPIPTTETDSEGRFRLVGLQAGRNLLTVGKSGYLPVLETNLELEEGQNRDLGQVQLQRGITVGGQIVDTNGQPVPGAQVALAASRATALVEFGRLVGPSDEDGRFSATGLPDEDVTLAARRGPNHPWVFAAPQSATRELRLQLPSQVELRLRLTSDIGAKIESPSLQLRSNHSQSTTNWTAALGFEANRVLEVALQPSADGSFVTDQLSTGNYTVLVTSANHARARVDFRIDQDRSIGVTLTGQVPYEVLVTDHFGQPIERAAVYASSLREDDRPEEPRLCGHTGADGRLSTRDLASTSVKFTSKHPAFGVTDVEVDSNADVVSIIMQAPGSIEGELWNGDNPVLAGEYTVLASRTGSVDLLDLGQDLFFAASDDEGMFRFSALQPGRYSLRLVRSEDRLNSPGSLYSFVLSMEMEGSGVQRVVDVSPGETSSVVLDVAGGGEDSETSTQISGSFTINGRPASGALIQVWGNEGQRDTSKVNRSGRFFVRNAPVGRVTLVIRDMATDNLIGAVGGSRHTLWHQPLDVAAHTPTHIAINLEMTSMSGNVRSPNGEGIENVAVRLTGVIPGKSTGRKDSHTVHYNRRTDREGAFLFDRIPAGKYTVGARSTGKRSGLTILDDVTVQPRLPVEGLNLVLEPAFNASGKVDLSPYGGNKPEGLFLRFIPEDVEAESGLAFSLSVFGRVSDEGTFEAKGLRPGRYSVLLRTNRGETMKGSEVITIGDEDLSGTLIKPVAGN